MAALAAGLSSEAVSVSHCNRDAVLPISGIASQFATQFCHPAIQDQFCVAQTAIQ